MTPFDLKQLQELARTVRVNSLKMTTAADSGHPGGSLSEAEILVSLYFHCMKVNPKNPKDPERDRFVLSKGHATPGLYSVLALRGFFPEKELENFRQLG